MEQEQQGEEPQIIKQLEPHEIEALIKKEAEATRETARLAAETRGGNITDFLPAGSYVCPTRGEAKAVYGDYTRIGMARDLLREEKVVVPTPVKEFDYAEHLLPGSYVCPTRGEAKAVYGDYQRWGRH